jgi:hypothetical protein
MNPWEYKEQFVTHKPEIRREGPQWVFFIRFGSYGSKRLAWFCDSWNSALSLLTPNRRACDSVQACIPK